MQIYWSKEALFGLERIRAYIRQHFSKRLADQKCMEIQRRVELLDLFPYSGLVDPLFEPLELGHRCVIKGPTRIVYRIIDSDQLLITHVYDMRMGEDGIKTP